MEHFIWYLSFLTLCVICDCEVYVNRPKIKFTNGDVILQPGLNRHIYLQTNGPASKAFVNDFNLLNINVAKTTAQTESDSLNEPLYRTNDIIRRLERLEQRRPRKFVNSSYFEVRLYSINLRLNELERHLPRTTHGCSSHPCVHGGTCLELLNDYHCFCPSNWEGKNCDEDVNECRNFAGTDLGCQNGATCVNKPGSYECLCTSGCFGLHCTKKAKDCLGSDMEVCGHGYCVAITSGDGIKCICDQGWTTNGTDLACLTDVNECDPKLGIRCSANPRVECVNLPGSFSCGSCPAGYEGDGFVCSDVDECQTLPNGGCSTSPMVTCQNTVGSKVCGPCPPGFEGDGVTCSWKGACNINNGHCHPSAQCIENTALVGVQCVCPEGMDGDGIGVQGCYVSSNGNNSLHCEGSPCGVNGHCRSLRLGYTCICIKGYTGAHCDTRINYCDPNPCLNGGTCRTDLFTREGYRCECTSQFSGDQCHVHTRTCGGVLAAEEGSITYPNSESAYGNNSRCAWVIHTTLDKVINVTFSKFNLEYEPDCLYDFLQIHDGRSSGSQLIGRFCGNNYPLGGNIISSHNNLYFWFRSDQSVSKEGFALHWTSIKPVCGGELNASSNGHISSPGSPGKYPPNRDCYWHLNAPLGKKIELLFFAFDIENHSNCSFDYLAIYDGEHTTDPLISKLCNSTLPAPVISAGSDVLIHFHSDAYSSGNGFQITYAPIEGVPGCGGYYTADRGEVRPPSYNGKYLNNLLCDYRIKTSLGNKIKIQINIFSIEKSFRCLHDHLKIYDGPSSDSRLVGTLCGNNNIKSFTSSSNALYIKFKSDQTVSGEGFKISYEAICQHIIPGDGGVITSPSYPLSYPASKLCEYIIVTDPGKVIQLSFQDLDIEYSENNNCSFDYVELRDGPNIQSTLLGRYCGNRIPPIQISTHNYLYIKFQSDVSDSGAGFYANVTTINKGCGGIYKDPAGVINYSSDDTDNFYKSNENCTWILYAKEGMHIQLSWNRFNVDDSSMEISCQNDYLNIIEIDSENNNNSLGRFCGNKAPPSLTTTTNRLMMNLVLDHNIQSGGFSLSYSFLDERSHCGGTYVGTHGFIYSPGWPGPYSSNRDCKWIIKVPMGQQITLNISNFDIERSIGHTCRFVDYLEIRNGATSTSPLVGKFCGSFKSRKIKSTSNALYLAFHSDYYLDGKGFQIEWDGSLTGCGGLLTSPFGAITSPNYPDQYYVNAECFYKVVVNPGSKIQFSFAVLDLGDVPGRANDFVEIFDGPNESSPRIGKYSSMNLLISKTFMTSSNNGFVKFRSGFLVDKGKGFLLNYETLCQNNITGSHGVIESPGYPSNYENDLNCLWIINVSKGNRINVIFTDFDLYKRLRYVPHTENCTLDSLQYKDGPEGQYSAKLCGRNLPSPIYSKSNSLQIKFNSHFLITRKGFRLEWVRQGCGGYLKRRFGLLSMQADETTNGELECEWIIETPLGTSVEISFTKVYMTDSQNCSIDSIEIYNGENNDYPFIARICHSGTAVFHSSSNKMLVKLIKNSSLKDVHFISNFNSHKVDCGGMIKAPSGSIHSKNYPKNYDDNSSCLWKLEVPQYHRIELNIVHLDLFSLPHQNDCKDSIKIYDDYNLKFNYSYIICPKSNMSKIVSKAETLRVLFATDGFGNAKGFQANFSMICGATISGRSDGYISNQEFVSYSNESCIWTVIAPRLDLKVTLTLTYMSLPTNHSNTRIQDHCPNSFLKIRDGSDVEAPLMGEYCGRKLPPMIVSHGDAMTLELGTYSERIQGTFSAHYSTISNACGGIIYGEEGHITSPNYPQSYPPNVDCEWTLQTSPGSRVYINFAEFDLEYSEACNEEYLEVRENDGAGRVIAVYCGNDLPTNTSTATKLYLKFHSNGKRPGRGFVIHFGFLHGNDLLNATSGEIASPLYPFKYDKDGEYFWRIISNHSSHITISIKQLEIPSYGIECGFNALTIYDGYDTDTPVLDTLCGVIESITKTYTSSSNALFIKLSLLNNTGSIFLLSYARSDMISTDERENLNCGYNETLVIIPGTEVVVTSPSYPNKYESNLNCEWRFTTMSGYHLNFRIVDIKLEETPGCLNDHISLFFKEDSTGQWKQLGENICLSARRNTEVSAPNLQQLKVKFKTDNGVNEKGFKARIQPLCGGLLSDQSGVFGPKFKDFVNELRFLNIKRKCEWTVKVRPGRTISFNFEHFNITNPNDSCKTYVIIRNGDSVDAPMLGDGKFCGFPHENLHGLKTSSNSLFVTYVYNDLFRKPNFRNFMIRYEEERVECGLTLRLDSEHEWQLIKSPNYPSVPPPFTECIWVFTGPPGEILRLDFIDRFDVDENRDCKNEFVEVRDGTSTYFPLIGRYCSESPATIKATNNNLYIKFFTQLKEPRNGFKANISIDVCGGTIKSSSGELISPGYPHMTLPYGSICEWTIIGTPGHFINIIPLEIKLPRSLQTCETKVIIEETLEINNSSTEIAKLCYNYTLSKTDVIQTSNNKVTVKLYVGRESYITNLDDSKNIKGFRFSFNSSKPVCGGFISTPEGFITTPGYPRETALLECQWNIQVPDRSRRIRLRILDVNDNVNVLYSNDGAFHSFIPISDTNDTASLSKTVRSSANKLSIFLWLPLPYKTHRFKAIFNSDEPALCGGVIKEVAGQLLSPNVSDIYVCEWNFDLSYVQQSSGYDSRLQTLYVTITSNWSLTGHQICNFWKSRIMIAAYNNKGVSNYLQYVCSTTNISFRIPYTSIVIKATKKKNDFFDFRIDWKLQPCGGVVQVGNEPIDVLSQLPDMYNDTLECAWRLQDPNSRIELSLQGTFHLGCDDEFIIIGKAHFNNEAYINYYCREKMKETPLSILYSNIVVQYHSRANNSTKIKLMVKTTTSQCGGYLSKYEHNFTSPNYPRRYLESQECVWEISTQLGYRISLSFVERFAIEDHPNCTKDKVIIYDWKDDSWQEIVRLCGRNMPPAFESSSNRMKVLLRTDSNINLEGFKATWKRTCGGDYIAKKQEQILYSPGYPNPYMPGANCVYNIISKDENLKVSIKFLDFELQGVYPECLYDNVTILFESYHHPLEYRYCGSEKPPLEYQNNGKISVVLKSDRYIEKRGFKLLYHIAQCGGSIRNTTELSFWTTAEGIENCTWIIEAPLNQIAIVKFITVNIDGTYECYSSFIGVYDGSMIDDDKRLALLCGNITTATTVESTNNTLLLQMYNNKYNQFSEGFKARITFSYSKSVGCGGRINLTSSQTSTIKSPFILNNTVYENFLHCRWLIYAPESTVIKLNFKSFRIAPCVNTNQTDLGFNKCDCDFVEIRDGVNPNSNLIQTYCGFKLPRQVVSTNNKISITFSTDGEITSSGFEIVLSSQLSVCGQTSFTVSENLQRLRSPGFEDGLVPRGIHCIYHFEVKESYYQEIHFKFNLIDIRSGDPDPAKCNKDKIRLIFRDEQHNATLGKDLILRGLRDPDFYSNSYFVFTEIENIPHQLDLCGRNKTIDLYFHSMVSITLDTDSEEVTDIYKGFELDVQHVPTCGRNYSDTEGRIKISRYDAKSDCNILITAAKNHTISVHFLYLYADYYNENTRRYLDIYDGKDTNTKKLLRINKEYDVQIPVFSSSHYLLLHSHVDDGISVFFDLNYLTTDKGQGCGGKLHNMIGKITSPSYPDTYRRKSSCVWELETPSATRLKIHFDVFDFGRLCDQNYLQLVGRNGGVISTFCSETPADYTSEDNYLKLVYTTTMNNAGTGWVAEFAAVA